MPTPPGRSDRAAPMTAAPFVWRDDGRPDWRSMWTTFCDLALHGGPPHRGTDAALREPAAGSGSDPAVVAEMRRGIWETTGLFAELQSPVWLAVTCRSRTMAEWLAAAIALENVTARVEADRVLLPAGPGFRVEDQVKSVVTVMAKTHHYWIAHARVAARSDRTAEAAGRHGFRCGTCGLDVHVSRPEAAADLDATCPIDGARMVRQARASWAAPVSGEAGRERDIPGPVKVGIGGGAHGRTTLIDALRRRYGRRRAVVASPAGASEVSDPAVDLVLVDAGDGTEASGFAPEMVDATIGVLDAPVLVEALARGGRELDVWRLLVVSTAGTGTAERARLEAEASRRRGPVALVDLGTAEGVDVIEAWLQRELLLDPWRRDHGRPS